MDRRDRFTVNGNDVVLGDADGTVLHPADARQRWPQLFEEGGDDDREPAESGDLHPRQPRRAAPEHEPG